MSSRNRRDAGAALRSLARMLMLAAGLVLPVLLLVPNTFLAFLRYQYRWIGRFMNWVELASMRSHINLPHVLAFAILGALCRLAIPRLTPARLLAGVLLLSAATETAQFWIPGRTPRISDIVCNVAGTLIGLAVAWPLAGGAQA